MWNSYLVWSFLGATGVSHIPGYYGNYSETSITSLSKMVLSSYYTISFLGKLGITHKYLNNTMATTVIPY